MALRAGLDHARIVGGQEPILPAIGRFVERDGRAAAASSAASAPTATTSSAAASALRSGGRRTRRYRGVNNPRIAGSDGQVGLADGRQAEGQLPPVIAAVGGFVDAAVGAAESAVLHETLLLLPHGGVDDVGILGIDADVVAAGVFVGIEHLVEVRAAIGRAEDAALRIGAVRMPEGRHEHPVGVLGVDIDLRDHLRIAQAQVRPGLARVAGFVHPVAHRKIGPDDARSAAHVNHVGIRRGDGDGADRTRRLVVEQRRPGRAVVGGAPHPAVVEAGIEDIGLAGDAGKRPRAPGASRPDGAPMHLGIKLGAGRLRRRERRQRQSGQHQTANPWVRQRHCGKPPDLHECNTFPLVDARERKGSCHRNRFLTAAAPTRPH